MSILRRTRFLAFVVVSLAGCGDKVPESAAAKKIGEQPKQILDKVTTDVNKALQKGTEARQDAEKKE